MGHFVSRQGFAQFQQMHLLQAERSLASPSFEPNSHCLEVQCPLQPFCDTFVDFRNRGNCTRYQENSCLFEFWRYLTL